MRLLVCLIFFGCAYLHEVTFPPSRSITVHTCLKATPGLWFTIKTMAGIVQSITQHVIVSNFFSENLNANVASVLIFTAGP
jgi:hypothetical protein